MRARVLGDDIQLVLDDALDEDGLLPVVEDRPPLRANERYIGASYQLDGDRVLAVYEVETIPADEIVARASDQRIDQALDDLRKYLNIAGAPTAGQTAAAVKLLCRVVISLVRRQRGVPDDD